MPTAPAGGPAFSVPNFGIGDAFIAAIQLRPVEAEIWRNGRAYGRHTLPEGGLQLFDLRHMWRAVLQAPYESRSILRIPLDLLAEVANTDLRSLVFDPAPVVAEAHRSDHAQPRPRARPGLFEFIRNQRPVRRAAGAHSPPPSSSAPMAASASAQPSIVLGPGWRNGSSAAPPTS